MVSKFPQTDASQEQDSLLVRLIQQKDESALSLLYDGKGRLVYSLAYNIVKNDMDAEEVTQEVFVRIWEKAATFDPERGSLQAWITTMTRRLAIDKTRSRLYKARGREMSIDASEPDAPSFDLPGRGQKDLEVGVQAREVMDALQQLDVQYREVIKLSYYEGLSHARIAERLEMPLGTVKSRLREAVAQLRRELNIKL